MKKQFKKIAVICASSLLAINFYSCEKNEAYNSPTAQNIQQTQSDGIVVVKGTNNLECMEK